jgi:uncharacterized protein DUF397
MIESPRAAWRRSTRCVSDHHCVEVADLGDLVGLRNSQRPELSLAFPKQAWQGFLEGVRVGDFRFDGK